MRYVVTALVLVFLMLSASLCVIASRISLSDATLMAVARQFDRRAGDDPTPVQFEIKEGETATTIADRLQKQGIISSAFMFRVLAQLRGADSQLTVGKYELRRNMTTNEVIDKLREARLLAARITTIEGWRAEEIADLIERKGVARREEFLSLVRQAIFDFDFLKGRPRGASLEGYLFPDTYDIPKGATATDVTRTMLATFDKRFDSSLRQKGAASDLTLHQVVTLASIVEREAVVAGERPLIAGVFLNRIKLEMPLQADATVQYAITGPAPGPLTDYWKKALTTRDLQVDSPYNTYRVKGLPPGPIANPGLASLMAVVEPQKTDYLYFVAKNDGSHAFARTLEEHNQNVAKYREGR
ncbi:MAG: endolytic transglycosylase MltG [Chloroflexi bacterium]|nr:endolytic transglycosylase MltG [Chloroflexota bacterium]